MKVEILLINDTLVIMDGHGKIIEQVSFYKYSPVLPALAEETIIKILLSE